MKRKIAIILTVCAVIAVLLIVFFATIPLVNDLTAVQTASELEALPLPEGTALIESISKAGKLVGNSNGMQYFGAILIKSDLSLDELTAHYAALGDYTVQKQTAQAIDGIEHGTLSFESEITGEGYFIVFTWGDGMGLYEELDLRGH